MKKTKFKPNLAFCGGCIYFSHKSLRCKRFTGPRFGYDPVNKVHCCIVKDIY